MDTTLQFKGLWAIILGGSGGFGFASAEKLAAHGMNVAVVYREMAAADKQVRQRFAHLAAKNNVEVLPFNINALTDDGRTAFMNQFSAKAGYGNVKVLVHAIARGNLKSLTSAGDESTLTAEDIELTTYAMSNSLLDWANLLIGKKMFVENARIIGLTSEGSHKYWDGYAAVSMAKASLESLCTYMAVEYSKFKINTNVIQAGITDTFSLRKIPGHDQLIDMATKRNPYGRITQPQDVAKVVYLLCTDEANWINGSIIHVDGGEHCR
ncbi:SDR family oxidoreductase [Mucilaginibacter ginkgonis]|uniref:SDR family oxidoreductase n=1 Tax=Mucilaginibacter ginkgonis TaxID=2682091 RepID=A0A6I4HY19_9SPHI|nr:SDR family oxidoreductase [Mucilaginibacter ginkgonis]QQL49466.1 SDR family oxidoreductase [Mucilaginibacter ginkgonis]